VCPFGAEQLYLIGWMAYDDGEHALAQRYLIQALRLAHETSSPELGAHVLAGLSDQATVAQTFSDLQPEHPLVAKRRCRSSAFRLPARRFTEEHRRAFADLRPLPSTSNFYVPVPLTVGRAAE
jgi:hypothetical protein